MTANRDTAATTTVLLAFQLAWHRVIEDYVRHEVNSEHCMQAALYHHMRNALPNAFQIYLEAIARLGETGKADTGKNKVALDMVVCYEKKIVAAIELKYTPRTEPTVDKVRKDLTSLALISNRKRVADRVRLEVPRYRHSEQPTLKLGIETRRKLIFATFCTQETSSFNEEGFWAAHKPKSGHWKDLRNFPPNLCIAIAKTNESGSAKPEFYGPPFERITTLIQDDTGEA